MRGTTPLEDTHQGRAHKRGSSERAFLDRTVGYRKQTTLEGQPDVEHDQAFMDVMEAEDDPALFAAAVDKLNPRERLSRSIEREEERLFREAIEELDKGDVEEAIREHENQQAVLEQLSIEAEPDLHGYSADGAIETLDNWLYGAYVKGFQLVLIITGKGMNSEYWGILRRLVGDYLNRNPRRIVRRFSPAPRRLGGRGAYVVELKQI